MVFREYPYLYQGSLADELVYLQRYARIPAAVTALALDSEGVVGAATGIPLAAESPQICAPILAGGLDPESIFYIGEILFLPGHRGKGLGSRLLRNLEIHARTLGFTALACATVERPPDHPQRPPGYLPIDGFCRQHGFVRQPDMLARLSWPDVGGGTSEKVMVFWLKQLGCGRGAAVAEVHSAT
jgi:GNAT superfamily N-acetyltransferase